ncbi:MAG: hypothetical protein GY861_28395, partial [bacterium]|nr:hypothetical protein [bacterium]
MPLSYLEKKEQATNHFDMNLADDDFFSLAFEEQDRIRGNYLKSQIGEAPPDVVQEPVEEVEAEEQDKSMFAWKDPEKRGFVAEVGTSLALGIDKAGEAIGGFMEMTKIPGGTQLKEYYKERSERPEIQASEEFREGTVVDNPERLIDWKWWTRLGGENLPNMLMMMGPGAAGLRFGKAMKMGQAGLRKMALGGAVTGAFTLESGSAYNQAKQEMEAQGGRTPEEIEGIATLEGVSVGVANSILEVLPFDSLLFKTSGGDKLLKRIVRHGMLEGSTESIQEGVNILAEQLGHAPDAELKDQIGRVIESGLAGILLGGGVSAVTPSKAKDILLEEDEKGKTAEQILTEDELVEPEELAPEPETAEYQARKDRQEAMEEEYAKGETPIQEVPVTPEQQAEAFVSDVEIADQEHRDAILQAEEEIAYRKQMLGEPTYESPVDVRKQKIEVGEIQSRKVGAEVPAVVEEKPTPEFETKPLEKALAQPIPEKKEPPKLIEQKKDFILKEYKKPKTARLVNLHRRINEDMNAEDFREMSSADLLRQKEQYSFEKKKGLAEIVNQELSQRANRKKIAVRETKAKATEKRKGATTFGGWIKETGGLNPANQRIDLLSRDKTGARLFKKDGRELEKAQDEAVKEGWILPSEDL